MNMARLCWWLLMNLMMSRMSRLAFLKSGSFPMSSSARSSAWAVQCTQVM